MRTLLVNARIILPDQVVDDGSVLVEDDRIAAVCPDGADAPTIDLDGAWLLPGLVDLHCDALEKEVEPRPKVLFPLPFAVAQADRRNAVAGITTPFHAISFSGSEWGVRNDRLAADLARAVHAHQGLIDNRVHLRYEVTEPAAEPVLRELVTAGDADLLSFMDHTPGRGQFRTFAAYRDYFSSAYAAKDVEIEQIVALKRERQPSAHERVAALATLARMHRVALASHDDDSPEFVETARRIGVAMSEFPINLATAQAAHAHGIATIFGAPNVIRGVSQSGNMRALDAIQAGVCACLCSDYHPPSLLHAAFLLPQLAGLTLPQAIRLVTANPAAAAGLADRGTIAAGVRADLIAVRSMAQGCAVELVLCAGRTVLRTAAQRIPALVSAG